MYEYFLSNPCVDCGETRVPCLQLDHKAPDTKRKAVANMVGRGYGLTTIKAEVAKCEVRCANCHSLKTAKDQGHYSYVFGLGDRI